MRSFPRAPRRRAATALSLAVLAVGALAVPQASADDLKDKKSKVESKIDDAQSDLAASSKQARRAAEKLAESRDQLAGAREQLNAVRGELSAAQARDTAAQAALDEAVVTLRNARRDLDKGRQRVEKQRRAVEDMMIAIYRDGDADLMAFESLLNAETPADLASEQTVRDAMVDDQERTYDELRATKVLLKVREGKTEEARDAVQEKRQEAAENLVQVQSLELQAESARDQVASLVLSDREVRQQAQQARQADASELRKLKAEEQRIQAELKRRAAEALRKARSAKSAAERATALRGPSGGVLSYPSNGYVSSGYGYRTHPIYGYYGLHNGTDFSNGGACGGPLYASADGTVMSSDVSSVYGNRLYLDHGLVSGRGLVSVYNHAASYTVSPGQRVSKGQVIGYMGDTGWSTGCHLHFSVLANGSYVDPMNWF